MVSITSRRSYGVKRVCSVWGVARSTFYATPPGSEPARRGPSPAVSDEELYALIAPSATRALWHAQHGMEVAA